MEYTFFQLVSLVYPITIASLLMMVFRGNIQNLQHTQILIHVIKLMKGFNYCLRIESNQRGTHKEVT